MTYARGQCYLWYFPQTGLECTGKLTETGEAAAEPPAPAAGSHDESRTPLPPTMRTDAGYTGDSSRRGGFILWLVKPVIPQRHTCGAGKQMTNSTMLLSALQSSAKPSQSPPVLLPVCVHVPADAGDGTQEEWWDESTQEALGMKI